jgi:hypothetical protein
MGGTAADTAVVPPVRSLATSRYLAAVLLRLIQHSKDHCRQAPSFSEPPER